MEKYVDMESGIVKQSGLEIEDVIQKILHDFFKYENNSLSTEDDDSKKRTKTHHKETMTNLTTVLWSTINAWFIF